MPYSDVRFDGIFKAFVFALGGGKRKVKVLDIGCGAGKTSKLIRERCSWLEGVEVWALNVERFRLRDLYDSVSVKDGRGVPDEELKGYDLVVLGDVMEHWTRQEAQGFLGRARALKVIVWIQVPFLYKQGALEGNQFEIHQQDDLTRENMKEHYPFLVEVYADQLLGCYYQG